MARIRKSSWVEKAQTPPKTRVCALHKTFTNHQGRAGLAACPWALTSLFALAAGGITVVQVSPASPIKSTLAIVFPIMVLPVPLPSKIPAHASFTTFNSTRLLFPVEQIGRAH